MKTNTLIFIVFLLLSSLPAFSSQDINFGTDTLVISRTDQNILFYKHKVNKQQKMDEVCELLGCDVSSVLQVNRINDLRSLPDRGEILIPISEKILVTEEAHKYDKLDQRTIFFALQGITSSNLYKN